MYIMQCYLHNENISVTHVSATKLDDFSLRYGDLTMCNMVAVRNVEFLKFKSLCHVTSIAMLFHFTMQNFTEITISCRVMVKKRFLKWRPSAILNFKNVHT